MQYEISFVNSVTNAPITGLTPIWTSLVKVSDGTAYSQPTISEVGGGIYKFTATLTEDVVGRIDGGAGVATSDRYIFPVLLSPSDAYLDGIKAKTDNLPASPAATSDIPSASTIATAVWAAGTRTLSSFGTLVADTATAVWGATTRTLSAFGFFTYTAPPTVAEIRTEMDSSSTKLAHLDADITSRLAASGYTAPDNTDIASILSAINDGTHGLAALLTSIGTRMATFTYTAPDNADIGTIKTAIESATYGLNALLTAIEAVSSTGATPEEIWGAAERSLTTANTDESPSRDMAAIGAVTGLYALTILVLDADDNPIPGVAVTLLNSDQTAFLSTLISDTDGYAHFSADPGVYKIRRMKAGYVFEDPDTVTIVDANVVHESRGVAYVIPASADPEMQILSGTHSVGGRAVSAKAHAGQIAETMTLDKQRLETMTAANAPHTWQLTLFKGIAYEININGWSDGPKEILVSQVAGADFSSYFGDV
jgi:hypothetical protein